MTALLQEQDLGQRIAAHNAKRHAFHSWIRCEELLLDVVTNDMEPNREHFWGWCKETGTYFISESVPIAHRIAVLQMEHHRREQGLTHLEAISFALEQPANIGYTEFLSTLYSFYQGEASSFEDAGGELSQSANEIIVASRYLKERLSL